MNPAPVSPFLSPYWRDEKAFRRSTRHSFSGRSSHFGTAGRFVLVLLASLLLAAGCDNNGPVEARLHTLGRVELLIPVNVDAEGRFWQNLARFNGTVTEDGRGSGRWTCAPFDLNSGGYRDVSLVVQGTWTFEPEP